MVFDDAKSIGDIYFAVFKGRYSDDLSYLETFSTKTSDLKDDLTTFYHENYKEQKSQIEIQSNESPTFKQVLRKSFSTVKKPFGRIVIQYTLNKYLFDNESALYLAAVNQQFICGEMCMNNGEDGFEPYQNFGPSYTHVGAYQSWTEVGYDQFIYSGIPIFKDAYPVCSPTTVTINSSYCAGVTVGYSTKLGFSSKGPDFEIGGSSSGSSSFTYSKSYTDTLPSLSTQNGQDCIEFQWTYLYDDTSTIKTNYMNLGYLFECNQYQNGIHTEDDFIVHIKAKAGFINNNEKEPSIQYIDFFRPI